MQYFENFAQTSKLQVSASYPATMQTRNVSIAVTPLQEAGGPVRAPSASGRHNLATFNCNRATPLLHRSRGRKSCGLLFPVSAEDTWLYHQWNVVASAATCTVSQRAGHMRAASDARRTRPWFADPPAGGACRARGRASRQSGAQRSPHPLLPAASAMAPRAVGRFRIERTLGVGAFSTVLLGVDDATGERYALKVMRKDTLEALDMAQYARREAFVLDRLSHPNVVSLVEAVQSDRKLFLVMPVAPGAELLATVADGPLSSLEAAHYASQLVDAVGYIHRKGVAHRDLKPENVMVDTQTGVLTLVDFGLTGIVRPDARMTTVCGSAFYSAPEVTYGDGSGYHGPAADAWSVGVLVYILLTGVHPWVASDGTLMVAAMRADDLVVPDSVAPDAVHFIRSLLVVDPSRRYSMAKAALHPWLASSRGETKSNPTASAPSRHRRSATLDIIASRHSLTLGSSSQFLPAGTDDSFLNPSPPAIRITDAGKCDSPARPSDIVSDMSKYRMSPSLGASSTAADPNLPSRPDQPSPPPAMRLPPKRSGTFSDTPPARSSLRFARLGSDANSGLLSTACARVGKKDPVSGVPSSSIFRFRRFSAAAAPDREAGAGEGHLSSQTYDRTTRPRQALNCETAEAPYPASKRTWHGVRTPWRIRRAAPDGKKV